MISLTLPDGSVHRFEKAVTGAFFVQTIDEKLATDAIAVKVNHLVQDLSAFIDKDAAVTIITRASPDALPLLRHDAAHILAEAVKELHPETQVTFGPATDTGFYYDFARDTPFSLDDLAKIEARMHEIVKRDEVIDCEVWDRKSAVTYFRENGEHFKAEWITSIPDGERLTIYRQGKWLDLCRGPHLPSTGKLGNSFKLLKVSGSYWRGDAKNAQLQRISGTCWASDEDLKTYLVQQSEADRRDHRRIGREMGLFHLQEETAGQVFWHHKGWTLFRSLESFIRKRLEKAGYEEVKTPQLVNKSLLTASGHWDMYGENMFKVNLDEGGRISGIKPMNCPCHVQIFKQGLKSYRDLPIRMSEFGACHRNEPSGALHGIMRLCAFTQDDAHIFCTEEQAVAECVSYIRLQLGVYQTLGFNNVIVKLALRPELRGGSDSVWDRAEAALRAALERSGLNYDDLPEEGAFYGPKIEFHLKDAIGRTWQCGTLQYDAVLPERLDAYYIGEDGQRHRPVMLHRAILGSMERFIGILIEHYAGRLPFWLTPVQAIVATVTKDANDWAIKVTEHLQAAGLRIESDLRNEKIAYKIREHSLAKVPFILVVGRREAEEKMVTIRILGGETQEKLDLSSITVKLVSENGSIQPEIVN